MDKVFVAQGVANRMVAAEAAVDRAIAEASQLVAEIIKARETLDVAAEVVDPAVTKASQSIAALADVRRTLIAAHHDLIESKLRIGIRTKMVGCSDKVTAIEELDLRRVG